MTPRVQIAALTLVIVGVSCGGESSTAGTPEGNCRRYIKLVDDLKDGKVDDEAEFLARLDGDIGEFKEGTGLRRSYDRLQEAITAQATEPNDERVSDAIAQLADTCLDVLDR